MTAAFALIVSVPPVSAEDSLPGADWTVMVYLDGDNNLDYYSYTDVEEMKSVGSTDDVNVIVLWDRYASGASLFKVLPGGIEPIYGFMYNGLEVNGLEIGMGDWTLLEGFVDFVIQNYPAEHFMLDIWDHGGPVWGICYDDHPGWYSHFWGGGPMLWDEVSEALRGHTEIDILAFDACDCASVEVAYKLALAREAKGLEIGYMVASEDLVPLTGYPYDHILWELNAMADKSDVLAVACMVADEYAESYGPHGDAYLGAAATLSVIDVYGLLDMRLAMSQLCARLSEGLQVKYDKYRDMVSMARGEASLPDQYGTLRYVDLPTFTATLSERSKDMIVRYLASEVTNQLKQSVVMHVANTPAMDSASAMGLIVCLPMSFEGAPDWTWFYFWYFEFPGDTGWLTFLFRYWHMEPPYWIP